MNWLGMSNDTLPGSSSMPKRKHPGAENIQRDEEREISKKPPLQPDPPVPPVVPAPKPKTPAIKKKPN